MDDEGIYRRGMTEVQSLQLAMSLAHGRITRSGFLCQIGNSSGSPPGAAVLRSIHAVQVIEMQALDPVQSDRPSTRSAQLTKAGTHIARPARASSHD